MVDAALRMMQIETARQRVLVEGLPMPWFDGSAQLHDALLIERSWRRCLERGQSPSNRVVFDMITAPAARRTIEENRTLIAAARPVIDRLARAMHNARYFAILTNVQGIVIDADGPIDRSDWRADVITRVGTDLSEAHVGATSISIALADRQSIWLHRGEHFLHDAGVLTCAGAPIFGPDGQCIGMLDLTGIEVAERPELRHLVEEAARDIENALAAVRPHLVRLRINWPGHVLRGARDGLVCFDGDGQVTGANHVARQMLVPLAQAAATAGALPHCSELFAMPWSNIIDAARANGTRGKTTCLIPLWHGLQIEGLAEVANAAGLVSLASEDVPSNAARAPSSQAKALPPRSLRDVEWAVIQQAIDGAQGNVARAAARLGISRATLYRRLAGAKRRD